MSSSQSPIYPLRLGLTSSSLVIQYYNLSTDKKHKHEIRVNTEGKAVEAIIREIRANPKENRYLERVRDQWLAAVLKGETYHGPNRTQQPYPQSKYINSNSLQYQGSPQIIASNIYPSESDPSRRQDSPRIRPSSAAKIEPIIEIAAPIFNPVAPAVKTHQPQEQEGYADQFDEISQSYGKSHSVTAKEVKVTPNISQSNRIEPKSVEKQIIISKKEDKPLKKQENKKQIQNNKKEQIIEEEYADDFDFLDDEQPAKKDKPKDRPNDKLKDKDKTKDSTKAKSKDKSKSKDKTTKDKPSKEVQSKHIQEDFDFL